MTNTAIKDLVTASVTIVFTLYGIWFLLSEVFLSFVPFCALFIIIIAVLIHLFRITPPGEDLVEAVVGKELHLENGGGYVMKTVAHRGAGLDAPENTLAAFNMCHVKGCDSIEFDVTLTSDDVPIVFHDATLERMADSNLVINKTRWTELSGIDVSIKHPFRDRFANTNIPTLDQSVAQMLSSGQRMFIDIKDNNIKLAKVILELFSTHPELQSRACVTSFFPMIIYLIRRSNPKIVCCLAYRPHTFANEYYKYPEGKGPNRSSAWYKHYFLSFCDIIHSWAMPRITYYLTGISIILLHKDCVSGEAILNWRSKGVRVIAWSVNSPVEKQHLARNLKITYLTDTLTGESTTHAPPI